jgi:hypothetical protein
MATRDLTQQFIAKRDKAHKGKPPKVLEYVENKSFENMENLIKQTEDSIKDYDTTLKELEKIYDDVFYDSKESTLRKEKQLLKNCDKQKKIIKKFISMITERKDGAIEDDKKVIDNIIKVCVMKYQKVTETSVRIEKRKQQLRNKDSEDPVEVAEPYYDPKQQQQLLLEQEEKKKAKEEFHKQAVKVAQDINAIHEMTVDLDNMIIEQGHITDRIDYNIEQTKEKVNAAEVENVESDKSSKTGSKISNGLIVGLGAAIAGLSTFIGIKAR